MSVTIDEDDYLAHYGILRKSGRYPWGSGDTSESRARDFLGMVEAARKEGLTDTEIARGWGMTTTEFRNTSTIANNEKKQADISAAQKLKDKGYSNVAIGKALGINESSVRALLKPGEKEKADILKSTADMLRGQVDEKKYLDVGKGVELHLNISKEKLGTAVSLLRNEGYELHKVSIPQLGTNKETTLKVLAPPGTTWGEVYRNRDSVQQIRCYSEDGGRSYDSPKPPLSISSKRVGVRYADQGGAEADGVIYVRPGVKDVSLGGARYAQVRIKVDDTHYLKGMAVYKDDLPPGVDLLFNTNKKSTGNKLDAMKPVKDDPTDPFGAITRQIHEIGPDGKKHVSSVMNIVGSKEGAGEEGGWDTWSRNLSSQMLSKQSPALAKQQLAMVQEKKKNELDEIKGLTNPAVQKHLLEKYADSADSAAVHLKAAALPRQATKVILPVNSLSDKEVYAPTFRDGERVVLVRFPHGGTFEIPELTVNNRHPEAKKLLGNAPDAIGIHSKVAERLSGADFDGDTVLVIPNNQGKIKTSPPLEGLKGFDPKSAYPAYDGMPKMTARMKGQQMGLVSNLITDMHVAGAPHSEIERAVKHSMVVIDAEKHNLDYKRSARENGIGALMKKYQGRAQGGASTLISKSGTSSTTRVNERKLRSAKEGGPIDPKTGRLVYVETGAKYPNGDPKTQKSPKLAETHDAHTLVSDSKTPIETIYADHSNALKGLANEARKQTLQIKPLTYSPSANKVYAQEVRTLDAKLSLALRNAPLERQAQVLGNAVYRQKLQANPDMEESEKKKLKSKALDEARLRTGAKKELIEITDREWEAIQAGAISNNKLEQILDNTNIEEIKKRATPKEGLVMDAGKRARAVAMLANDKYTLAEVADHLGVSVSTLKASLAGGA